MSPRLLPPQAETQREVDDELVLSWLLDDQAVPEGNADDNCAQLAELVSIVRLPGGEEFRRVEIQDAKEREPLGVRYETLS